jgi:hypothetical protein
MTTTTTTSTTKPSRLETIATRQKKTFVRDALFAVCVAGAALVGMTTVAAAAHAGAPVHSVSARG